MRLRTLIGSLSLTVFAAAGVGAQDYYADVRPLIEERCVQCHASTGIAFSMEDAERTYEKRRDLVRMVAGRRMPPWLAEAGHQEYEDDLSLDPDQIQLMRDWADAGFPKGTAPAHRAVHATVPGFRADLTLEIMPGASYLPMQDESDDYRCFVVDWPRAEPGFVTGFRTDPGNHRVAHHTVVHAASAELRDRFHELDAEEEGLGYQCFGGAVPDRLGDSEERDAYEARYPDGVRELNDGSFWLAHWAPGMYGNAFPEGTGIPVEPGGALIVQMHYYSLEAPGEEDHGTTLEFQIADDVERPAFHLPQTNNRWLNGEGNGSMVIPAGEQVTYQNTITLSDWLGYVAYVTGVDEEEVEALEIHSANLHMHAIGHSGAISLIDPDGRKQVLLSVPRWDLAWQRDFTFVEPKVFTKDELERTRITVECTFENPTDQTVYGGFGSDEEMCFNFSYVAVRGADGKPVVGSRPGS